MNKTVGIVHGGLSHEREKSLVYGKLVSKILSEAGIEVLDMHLHPNGSWTINGKTESLEDSIKKSDLVWNCLVGVDGENGALEELCAKCKTKVLSNGQLHSQLSHDKKNMQHVLAQHKIKSPYGKVILKNNFTTELLKEVFTYVGIPAIVKPLKNSGAWGVTVVSNWAEFEQAVNYLISENQDVLVEKVISGVPVSCFVMEHDNLLHTNIKIQDENLTDKNIKISRDDFLNIRNEALYIHNILAFPHHVEYEFILTNKNGKNNLYFIEANTNPSLVHGYIKDSFKEGSVGIKDYILSKVFST